MNCPRCQAMIHREDLLVCKDCGWMPENKQMLVENHIQRQSLLAFILITVTSCVLFVHSSTWDQHSLSIIPAKVSQILGLANQNQLIDIAEMCHDRMMSSCEEDALNSALQKSPNNLVIIERLANLKELMKKDREASFLYKKYFALGGMDARAAYKYANILTHLKNYDSAEKYYVTAIEQKPDVLQVSVNEAYVKMLMKTQQLKKAIAHIKKLREQGAPEYFLAHEYRLIESRLGRKG